MSDLKISNLNVAGAELFQGEESFLSDLQETDSLQIHGGTSRSCYSCGGSIGKSSGKKGRFGGKSSGKKGRFGGKSSGKKGRFGGKSSGKKGFFCY